MNGGKYTGLDLGNDPRVIQEYTEDTAKGSTPIDFKVFTASFDRGREVW
jgi:hypothetical protein